MSNLIDIVEKLKLNNDSKASDRKEKYKFFPKTPDELKELIKKLIKERGLSADLNDIDTSEITDMHYLFGYGINNVENIDISKWDVYRVTNMANMFTGCTKFNCDLSNWNTHAVTDMSNMFKNCTSFNSPLFHHTLSLTNARSMFEGCTNFNQDISNWNTRNLSNAEYMFKGCVKFNQNISSWKLPNIKNINWMFLGCHEFNQDLSKWRLNRKVNKCCTFLKCEKLDVIPTWYKK